MRNLINGFSRVVIVLLLLLFIPKIKATFDFYEKKTQLDLQLYNETYSQRLVAEQLRLQSQQDWAIMIKLIVGLILLIIVVGVGILLFQKVEEIFDKKNEMVNGSFALRQLQIGDTRVLVDPNKMKQAFAPLTEEAVLGSAQAFENEEKQLKLLSQVHGTRVGEHGIKYSAHAKLLAGAYTKNEKEEVITKQLSKPKILQLSLNQAIEASTTESWIMGQNDNATCNLNIHDLVHVGLVGATKTGKTSSTALLTMIYAIKYGFQVIVLDGVGGTDWKQYSKYCEVHDLGYENFQHYINQICKIHDSRMAELRKEGVSDIRELKSIQVPSILCIIDEFGYVCQALQQTNKSQYKETISDLSNLMRVSRRTGIHFLLVDQKPNSWDKAIIANVKGWLCYRIKGHLANGIGEYYIGDLKEVGEFSYENEKYLAWFTKAEATTLLQELELPKNRFCFLVKLKKTLPP